MSKLRGVAGVSLRRAGRVDGRHPGAGPVPAEQEPLGGQLAVRVDDEASRDAEVRGKHPWSTAAGSRRQPAGADGVAQPVGELAVQRFRRGPVEFDQQLRTEVVPETAMKVVPILRPLRN